MSKIQTVIHLIQEKKIIDYLRVMLDNCRSRSQINVMKKQRNMLVSFLKYANINCKYYSDMGINVNEVSDIYKYPLLCKDQIRDNFKDIVSKKYEKMFYRISHTGGSTGEPLEFFNSATFDGYFQKKIWRKNGFKNGDIILAMDGTKIPDDLLSKGIYWTKKDSLSSPYGQYALSSLYLTEKNIEKYCKFIIKLKPSFIRGYPSFVFSIANYIIEKRISIDFEIKAIELTSESSLNYQLEVIKRAFNSKIILQYGHTECCVFGYTFDDSLRYRIEPLYGYVEILNENGKPVRKGEIGEVIVTSLHNKVMPLIRYRTGDLAVFGGFDNKGMILNQVIGRTQDYIVNRNKERVLLTALIFAQHFSALGNIRQWQIMQNEVGIVNLSIVKSSSYGQNDEIEIKELFEINGNVDVNINYVEYIEKTKRGKSKMLLQYLL